MILKSSKAYTHVFSENISLANDWARNALSNKQSRNQFEKLNFHPSNLMRHREGGINRIIKQFSTQAKLRQERKPLGNSEGNASPVGYRAGTSRTIHTLNTPKGNRYFPSRRALVSGS